MSAAQKVKPAFGLQRDGAPPGSARGGYANQQQHNLAMQPQYAEEAARVIQFSSLYDRKNRNTINLYIATPTIDCFRHAGNFSLGYHALS